MNVHECTVLNINNLCINMILTNVHFVKYSGWALDEKQVFVVAVIDKIKRAVVRHGNPSSATSVVASLNIVRMRPRSSFVSVPGFKTATSVFQTLPLVNGVGRIG